MLERFKREEAPARDDGAVATAERPHETVADRPTTDRTDRTDLDDRTEQRAAAPATAAALATARARQRDEFGGINWGASFFGWLVALGIAALLTSLLVAAGAAIGLTESDVTNAAEEITLGGGIALLAVLMLAYGAGGYVAGRMSRFDGARQGAAVWAVGLIVTVALAALAAIFGDEYNVLEELNLPAVPVGDQAVTTGGAVAIAAILVGSLLTAVMGGKLGERYHRRVDRAGFTD